MIFHPHFYLRESINKAMTLSSLEHKKHTAVRTLKSSEVRYLRRATFNFPIASSFQRSRIQRLHTTLSSCHRTRSQARGPPPLSAHTRALWARNTAGWWLGGFLMLTAFPAHSSLKASYKFRKLKFI